MNTAYSRYSHEPSYFRETSEVNSDEDTDKKRKPKPKGFSKPVL